MGDRFSEISARLDAMGVQLSLSLIDDITRRLGGSTFAGLFDESTAPVVAGLVWKALLDAGIEPGERDMTIVLAVHHAARADGPATAANLPWPLNWEGTWLEINVRLAGACYDQHRALLGRQAGNQFVRASLIEAVDAWEVLEENDGMLKGPRGRIWRGQRAVAGLVLARQDSEPSALLLGAVRDFTVAAERGDRSKQHFSYRLEAFKRLLDLGHDARADAQLVIDQAVVHDIGGRAWLASLGDLQTSLGQYAGHDVARSDPVAAYDTASPDTDEAQPWMREASARYLDAIDSYTQALACAPDTDLPDGLVRAKRGIARQRLAWIERAVGRASDELLDKAIVDLRSCSEAGARLRGRAFPAALLQRSSQMQREGRTEESLQLAEEGYTYCLCYPDEVDDQHRVGLACHYHTASLLLLLREPRDTGLPLVEEHVAELLALPDNAWLPLGPLASAVMRLAYGATNTVRARRLMEQTLDRLRSSVQTEDSGRRWAAEWVGRLSGQLASMTAATDEDEFAVVRRRELLVAAHASFREALPPAGVQPEPRLLWGLGLSALQYGKAFRHDEAPTSELFEEAVDRLLTLWNLPDLPRVASMEDLPGTASLGGAPSEAVVTDAGGRTRPPYALPLRELTSYLGEAYLRLHAVNRSSEDLASAISWLDRSVSNGNDSEAVFGLVGDAHYRAGRQNGTPASFRAALEWKQRAREANAARWTGRENWSVSAACHRELWKLEHRVADFTEAVRCSWAAAETDATWPWPLLQLLNLAEEAGPDEVAAVISDERLAATTVASLVAERGLDRLRLLVAERAAGNRQFRTHTLGGRSQTFVLNDPHQLLSVSLVIKPADRADALAEADRARSLDLHLRTTGAPEWMQVPAVLGVVPSPLTSGPVNYAYVTRRAYGRSLAMVIQDRRQAQTGITDTQRAARFLARIHGWLGGVVEDDGVAFARMVEMMIKFAERAGLADAPAMIDAWARQTVVCPGTMPGRDAHAENWLVSRDSVVALDFEEHPRQPLLHEIVQLIEDHAVLPLNDAGDKARIRLCRVYLSELAACGFPLRFTDAELWRDYQVFAFARAVFLLGYLPRKVTTTTDAAFLQSARLRFGHARALVSRLGTETTSPDQRDVCQALLEGAPLSC
ncbi:hypothetical protein AB0C07_20470 [Actinoplanes missouriensis]|uniref:hypothetical protein n=1 Tax=Actinoplanes missouriensis TaxID=1866 RepID=UPI0033F7DAD9